VERNKIIAASQAARCFVFAATDNTSPMTSQCSGSDRLIPDGPPPAVPMQCPECGRNVQVESRGDGTFIEPHEQGVEAS
jgi:hypothetical protein